MTEERFRLLELWIKAIENDLVDSDAWLTWAFQQIESSSHPEEWITDLALVRTKRDALEALYEARANVRNIRWLNETRFAIGLLYLRHLKGQLTLNEVLRDAGKISDSANADSPTCETYFRILSLLESQAVESPERRELEETARQLLEPQARFVKSELAKLPINA